MILQSYITFLSFFQGFQEPLLSLQAAKRGTDKLYYNMQIYISASLFFLFMIKSPDIYCFKKIQHFINNFFIM